MQSGAGGGGGGGAAAAAAAAAGGDYNDVTAARRGRFRVTSSTPTGPPETTLGRFRLMPTCKCTLSPSLSLLIPSSRLHCLHFLFFCSQLWRHLTHFAARSLCRHSGGAAGGLAGAQYAATWRLRTASLPLAGMGF